MAPTAPAVDAVKASSKGSGKSRGVIPSATASRSAVAPWAKRSPSAAPPSSPEPAPASAKPARRSTPVYPGLSAKISRKTPGSAEAKLQQTANPGSSSPGAAAIQQPAPEDGSPSATAE